MQSSMFITLFNTRMKPILHPSADDIISVIKDLIKPKYYVPYDEKIKLVEQSIQKVSKEKYPTPMLYRQLIIDLVNYYTDLEINKESFDDLCYNNLINFIISTFQNEYTICNSIMQMLKDDMMING